MNRRRYFGANGSYFVLLVFLTRRDKFSSNRVTLYVNIHSFITQSASVIQGGPAKMRPIYNLMVTFECIGKIQ